MLRLIEEAKNGTYEKLIDYAIKTCDTILFVIRYDFFMYPIKKFDRICEIMQLNELELQEEYKKNGIKNVFSKLRYDKEIFILEEDNNSINYINFQKEILKDIITSNKKNVKQYMKLKNKMNEIRSNLKYSFIMERHNPQWCGTISTFDIAEKIEKIAKTEYQHKGDYMYDICFYKTTPKVKEFLLKQKRLYQFMPPNLPEDICFFRNGYCWLKTISHERQGYIYGENREEIQYLKNIGLKFEEYEISKEDIPYEEY